VVSNHRPLACEASALPLSYAPYAADSTGFRVPQTTAPFDARPRDRVGKRRQLTLRVSVRIHHTGNARANWERSRRRRRASPRRLVEREGECGVSRFTSSGLSLRWRPRQRVPPRE
jgi:hypothetical protein